MPSNGGIGGVGADGGLGLLREVEVNTILRPEADFQMVHGRPHGSEVGGGLPHVEQICHGAARGALGVLQELLEGEREATQEVLQVIETNRNRLRSAVESLRSRS